MLTEVNPLVVLDKLAAQAGSQKALAAKLQISPSYLSDVMNTRREPSGRLLEALGLRRAVVKAK